MDGERTEAPTPKRRDEVRKRGQTSRSRDLTGAVVLLAGLYAIKNLAGGIKDSLSVLLVDSIRAAGAAGQTTDQLRMDTTALAALAATLPRLLGLMAVAALVVSVLQGGFMFVPGLLTPKWDRMSPIGGMKRLISPQGLMQLLASLAKFAVVGLIVISTVRVHLGELAALGALDLLPALTLLVNMIWDVALKATLGLIGLGILDWLWQRRRHLQALRMTKQEVKEEARQTEGDPEVRGQIRGRRLRFMQELMKDVRTADVVITNPTHYAVALRYDPETMAAPTVIAKGKDFLALRIREVAVEAHVPIVENPPLARALHKLTPVGREIPAQLYVAVAEVLAFVFRLRQRQTAA